MMILDKWDITHGDLKNEGTENLHSLENQIFDRGISKGEKDEKKICQDVVVSILEYSLLRTEEAAQLIINNFNKEIKLYVKGGWKKKESNTIFVNNNVRDVAIEIKTMVQKYTGEDRLFEKQSNYVSTVSENKTTKKKKTKYVDYINLNLIKNHKNQLNHDQVFY